MKDVSVLIVEDEMVISMELVGTLRRLGYHTAGQVVSGEEAVQKAGELRPDIILMDIRLKGSIDGIEAARIIRKEYAIPVIFLTAHSDDITLQRAVYIQPSAYLIKPFRDRELYSAIELALHRKNILSRLFPSYIEFENESEKELENLIDPAMIISDRWEIISVNNAVFQAFGYEKRDLIGKIFDTLVVLPDDPGHFRIYSDDYVSLKKRDNSLTFVRIIFKPLGEVPYGERRYLLLVKPV